jgi:hypothetical protein
MNRTKAVFEGNENATMTPMISMPWVPFGIVGDHTVPSPHVRFGNASHAMYLWDECAGQAHRREEGIDHHINSASSLPLVLAVMGRPQGLLHLARLPFLDSALRQHQRESGRKRSLVYTINLL